MIPELNGFALMLKTTHRLVHRALDGLSPEQALARPNGANPIVWIAGHMVVVRAGFANGLGAGVDVPWASHFPRGGEVKNEAEWPTLSEVRAKWDEVHAAFMTRLEGIDAAALAAETPMPGLDKTLLGALALAALHDSYHVGQLAAARRLHGHDRVVG